LLDDFIESRIDDETKRMLQQAHDNVDEDLLRQVQYRTFFACGVLCRLNVKKIIIGSRYLRSGGIQNENGQTPLLSDTSTFNTSY